MLESVWQPLCHVLNPIIYHNGRNHSHYKSQERKRPQNGGVLEELGKGTCIFWTLARVGLGAAQRGEGYVFFLEILAQGFRDPIFLILASTCSLGTVFYAKISLSNRKQLIWDRGSRTSTQHHSQMETTDELANSIC